MLSDTPDYLHQVPAFGIWSLPVRSSPSKLWLEDQLDKAIGYYQKEWAERAWHDFLNNRTYFNTKLFNNIETLEPVYEVEGLSTNNAAQWGLNVIQLLELIGDQLPEEHERFHLD